MLWIWCCWWVVGFFWIELFYLKLCCYGLCWGLCCWGWCGVLCRERIVGSSIGSWWCRCLLWVLGFDFCIFVVVYEFLMMKVWFFWVCWWWSFFLVLFCLVLVVFVEVGGCEGCFFVWGLWCGVWWESWILIWFFLRKFWLVWGGWVDCLGVGMCWWVCFFRGLSFMVGCLFGWFWKMCMWFWLRMDFGEYGWGFSLLDGVGIEFCFL